MPRRVKITFSSFAIATAFGFVAAFMVAPSFADDKSRDKDRRESPDATWSVPRLDVSIKPGETRQFQVTLTARDKLDEGVVRIVPALSANLQVMPTSTPRLRSGETQVFTLTFSATIDALPKTLEGVMQLREVQDRKKEKQGANLTKPLRIVLDVVWPQFDDPTSGLRFAYPPVLSPVYDEDTGATLLKREPSPEDLDDLSGAPFIVVAVDENPAGLTAEQFYDGAPGADLGPPVGTDLVAGLVGIRFDPIETLAGHIAMVVPLPGRFLVIKDIGSAYQENGVFSAVLRSLQVEGTP